MGIKSYIAGNKADSVNSVVDTVFGIGNFVGYEVKKEQALKVAKDTVDVKREGVGIDGQVDTFLNDLKFDREWETYGDKVEAQFGDMSANIESNTLLSDSAKQSLINTIIPQKKASALSKVKILGYNAQMAEVEVGVDQHGDLLASDPKKDMATTVSEFKGYVEDLGIYNEGTVGKMVKDYSYSTAPIKALQVFEDQYKNNHTRLDYSSLDGIGQIGKDSGLDAFQQAALKKSALTFQKEYDAKIDAEITKNFDIKYGEIYDSMDNAQIYDASSLDSLIDQVPPRFKSNVIKMKNTANTNNDVLLTNQIAKIVNTGEPFTAESWALVDTIYDPTKRDAIAEEILSNEGRVYLNKGDNLADALKKIDAYDTGEVSEKNKRIARGVVTKEFMVREGNSKKAAEDLMSSMGWEPGTEEAPAVSENVSEVVPGEEPIKATEESSKPVATPTETSEDMRVMVVGTSANGDLDMYEKPLINGEMEQGSLLENILTMIKDGHGSDVSEADLKLIKDDKIREEVGGWASQWDYGVVDSPGIVNWLTTRQYDETVTQESQRRITLALLNSKVITEETALKRGSKPSLSQNPNMVTVKALVGARAKDIYPKDSGKQIILDNQVMEAVELAAINNPKLLEDNGEKMLVMVDEFTLNKLASSNFKRLEKLTRIHNDASFKSVLKGVESQKLNNFMYKAVRGDYDMFLNPAKVQEPSMLMGRAKANSQKRSLDQTMDAVTSKFTGYDTYDELKDNGTDFEKTEVLVNANFILASGTYETALTGSFGFQAKDMKVIDKNWAYQDPNNPDIWFFPAYDEVKSGDKLAWGMYLEKDGVITNRMTFDEYVDPKLVYEAQQKKDAVDSDLFQDSYARLQEDPKSGGMYKDVPAGTNIYGNYRPPTVGISAKYPTAKDVNLINMERQIKDSEEAQKLVDEQLAVLFKNRATIMSQR